MWGTGPVLQGWAADPPVGLIPDSLIAASIARLSQLQDWALTGGIAIPESAIDAEIARVVGVAGWARVPAQSLVPESAIDLAIARVSQLTGLPSGSNGEFLVYEGGAWGGRSLNGAPIDGISGHGAAYYKNGALRFLSTAGRSAGDYVGVSGGAMAWLEHPAHILHGAGVPTAAQGQIDDYYLQTTDPPRWYQKTTGTTWALQYTWPASSGGQTAQQVLNLIAGAVPFWARIDEHDVSLADIPALNMSPNFIAAGDAAVGDDSWRTGGGAGDVANWARIDQVGDPLAPIPSANMSPNVAAAVDDALGNTDWRTPDTATLNIGGLISVTPTLQDRIAIADESDSQTVRQAVLSQVRSIIVPEWGRRAATAPGIHRPLPRASRWRTLALDAGRAARLLELSLTALPPPQLDAVTTGQQPRKASSVSEDDHHDG